jgi:hypothetical protein
MAEKPKPKTPIVYRLPMRYDYVFDIDAQWYRVVEELQGTTYTLITDVRMLNLLNKRYEAYKNRPNKVIIA